MRPLLAIGTILVTAFSSGNVWAVEKEKPKKEELIALIEALTGRVATPEAQAHDAYTDAEAVETSVSPADSMQLSAAATRTLPKATGPLSAVDNAVQAPDRAPR